MDCQVAMVSRQREWTIGAVGLHDRVKEEANNERHLGAVGDAYSTMSSVCVTSSDSTTTVPTGAYEPQDPPSA